MIGYFRSSSNSENIVSFQEYETSFLGGKKKTPAWFLIWGDLHRDEQYSYALSYRTTESETKTLLF